MSRKVVSVWLVAILLIGMLVVIDVFFDIIPRVRAWTWYVDDVPGGSPPEDFTSIQEAVDWANPGDIVYVYSGTYNEDIYIYKEIELIGENRDTTIIHLPGGYSFFITANNVEITGFTVEILLDPGEIYLDNVQNCNIHGNNFIDDQGFTIELHYSNSNIISNNNFYNTDSGIFLGYSDGNTITNNIISSWCNGVGLVESDNNLISNNEFNNSECGLQLYLSNNNNIQGNTFLNNCYGILIAKSNGNTFNSNTIINNDDGFFMEESDFNIISNNIVDSNNNYGIVLHFFGGHNNTNNTITGNNVSNNQYGISLYRSSGNDLIDNNVSLNDQMGIFLDHSNGNKITGNNVSTNGIDGIFLWYSNANNVTDNDVSLNSEMGINLYFSSGNKITNNLMVEDGIFIQGDLLEHWNSHNIDTSNTVNGKSVCYCKNQTGGIIPADAGEIILANCTNITTENQGLTSGSVGIEFGFSANNTILSTTISDEIYGVFSYSSQNNSITNCTISNCDHDFGLDGNSHVIALNTTFNDANVYFQDSISTLTVKWYLHVNVTNVAGEPIPNALVCVKDNRNTLPPQRCRTKIDGYARWLIETEYIKSKYVKTFYTPHKITAWNETLLGFTEVNINESKEVNVVLDTPIYEISLESGWNLISLPLLQSDTSIPSVLSSIAGNYDKVMWFNASDQKWHSSDDELTDLDHTMGFWIYMKTADTLIVTGDIPNTTLIQLYKGWNLVGNPSFCIHAIDEILGPIVGNYTTIWSYYAWDKKDTWKVYNIDKPSEFIDLTYMTCGRGYWIYVTQDCVWEVSNF